MGSGADSPCQGEMAQRARGGREGEYEREALILSRPRGRFGYFAAMGKVTRRPQAAESPCEKVFLPPQRPPNQRKSKAKAMCKADLICSVQKGKEGGGELLSPQFGQSPGHFFLIFRVGVKV